ncbi:MAG: hypothetical protein HQL23_08430 [Candidatus Omnitrophica bacterium]|nr:hypothetical protein [Candidatus Omnitrophota bacterium]
MFSAANRGVVYLLRGGALGWAASGRQPSMIRNQHGQNLLEYTMVAAIIAAVVMAMSTYVNRSVQATQQQIQKEFQKSE